MSFSQENGYTALTFDQIMDSIRQGVNTQFGTSYTVESFVGTNWYKYAYQIAQKIQENEVKLSEVFQKVQQYIELTNESIRRPSVSLPGLIDAFDEEGYLASVKPTTIGEAGLMFICVDIADAIAGKKAIGSASITVFANLISGTPDSITVAGTAFTAQAGAVTPGGATFRAATSNAATATSLAAQINAHATVGLAVTARAVGSLVKISANTRGTAGNALTLVYTNNDANIGATVSGATLSGGTAAAGSYASKKLEVATLIKSFVAAGLPTQGPESTSLTLSNGQAFDFKFYLPDRITVKLRLSITTSENNQILIPDDEDIREVVFNNIAASYKLGKNFEPQRYFTLDDAEWASDLVLEWSEDNGVTWNSTVYNSDFDEVFTIALEDIDVVIT